MTEWPAIALRQITKDFGRLRAVDHLNVEVHAGDIFGFLGPNGAGKSTTIRMLLSLVKPDGGEIFIFGKELQCHRREILRRIGCIIEEPGFYPYLPAATNLELFAKLSGCYPDRKKIYETLDLVGLHGREQDPVKTYSHGMKQRLGIAQAIIHDPDLIILDEPTTGLDPQGIIDVRHLILHLRNDLGKTIFLSSHLLSEVEQMASRMVIINKGQAVVQGTVSELLSSEDLIVTVETSGMEQALSLIATAHWQTKMVGQRDNHIDFRISREMIPQLSSFFASGGIAVYGISYRRKLEDYFLKLTQMQA